MAIVNININRREYEVACGDGEEQHLINLSFELDKRIKGLGRNMDSGNQTLLLVVAALQMLDEMHEVRTQGARQNVQGEIEKLASASISQLTDKIEDLARRIEKRAAS